MIRINLQTLQVTPDAAPYWPAISQLPPDTWPDLTDHGYPGIGYWPSEHVTPDYDLATHKLGAEILTPDAERKVVVVTHEVVPLTAEEIAQREAAAQAASRAARKAEREAAVAAIKVTTQAGHTFDGDEVSQGRMARAIIALSAAGGSVNWVLADNTIAQVTAAELTEALALAGAAQAAIWVAPYAPAA